MSESNKKVWGIAIISIIALGTSVFGAYYVYSSLLNLPAQGAGGGSQYLSGTYTGDQFFSNDMIVAQSASAIMQDGSILGGEITVLGSLSLRNITIDHDINVIGTGELILTNVILKNYATISLDDNSVVNVTNLQNYGNQTNQMLYTYGNVRVFLNDTSLEASFYENTIVNGTNLHAGIYSASEIVFYDNSQGTIINSEFSTIQLGTIDVNINQFVLLIVNNTNITSLRARFNSTTFLYNNSFVDTYRGYENTTLYNDSTSWIDTIFLYGNAQQIGI